MVVLSFRSTQGWPEFWSLYGSYTTAGVRGACSFTRLIQNLRVARKLADEKDVIAAKAMYGDRFNDEFSLIKAGKHTMLTKSQDIARRYREKQHCHRWWDEIEAQ
jgi:hypothetical protein